MVNLYDPKAMAQVKRGVATLVKAKTKSQTQVDYTKYADDPAGFIRDVLKDDLVWNKTAEIIESVRVNRKTTVKGANSVGKDHTAAELALWWMYAKNGLVIVTGPTQKQVFEIFFGRELRSLSARAGLARVQRFVVRPEGDDRDPFDDPEADATYDTAEGRQKCGILGVVSTDVSKMTGHHAPYVMCIISEAQGVTELAFSTIFNNATGEYDRFLVVGNPIAPTPGQDDFAKTFFRNSDWHPITIPATEHPNVVQERQVIPGGPSRVWLNDVRRLHGEQSSWWKTFVLAEFPQTSSDVLFTDADLAKGVKNWDGPFRASANGQRLTIGVDVAKGGGDACAIAVWRGRVLERVIQFETTGIIETEQRIVQELQALGLKKSGDKPYGADPLLWGEAEGYLVIDAAPTGGGPGIIAHLTHDHGYDVVPFNGAAKVIGTSETERYENRRAHSYWSLHVAMQEGRCAIPDDSLLLEELRAITWQMNKQDGIQVVRKPEIRKLLKRSPDRADAAMMGWSEVSETETIGGIVANLGF